MRWPLRGLPWQRALHASARAKRYQAYCYPHFNPGWVYEQKHQWQQARQCYARAHEMNPQYSVALVAIRCFQAKWN